MTRPTPGLFLERAGRRALARGRRCHHCGAQIDVSEWYPVETVVDESGALEFLAFCSAACRDAHGTG